MAKSKSKSKKKTAKKSSKSKTRSNKGAKRGSAKKKAGKKKIAKKKTSKKKAGKKKASSKAKTASKRAWAGSSGEVISAGPATVDWDDEQAVLREVAMTLGEEDILDQLDIEETSHMFTGVKAYRITTGGLRGREWYVMLNDEEAYDEAVARVKQDLEESPEMFPSWLIESHINMDKLKKWVHDANMEDPYAEEIAKDDPDRFWEEFEGRGLSVDEYETTDEDGETVLPEDVPESAIESFREDQASDWEKDPMGYLEQFESAEDARKRAIDIAGIDEDEAADEVVRGDGWAHTLASYDSDYQETPSRFVVFRTN